MINFILHEYNRYKQMLLMLNIKQEFIFHKINIYIILYFIPGSSWKSLEFSFILEYIEIKFLTDLWIFYKKNIVN